MSDQSPAISDDIRFDLEIFRGQRALLQGASGSGKSTAVRLLLEASYGSFQHLIIDSEDEFHTLRTAHRDYAIIGGDHGDAPLSPNQDAGGLATTLLKVGVSTVLQIGDWTLEHKRAFIGAFVAGLMRSKPDLWHPAIVSIDEAHLFVPQQGVVASSEAVTHLATAGRKRGFSAIFATQRLSLISKDVLGQCENKFLGRVEQTVDRRAVADLLGFTPRSSEAVDMQGFRPGQFYVVGPALAPVPTMTQLHKAETRVPEPGSTVLPTPTPAVISSALAELARASKSAASDDAEKTAASPKADGNYARDHAEVIAAAEKRAYERGRAEGFREGRHLGYKQASHTQMIRVIDGLVGAAMLNGDNDALEVALAKMRGIEIDAGSSNGRTSDFDSENAGSSPAPATKPSRATVPEKAPDLSTAGDLSPSAKKIIAAIQAAYPIGLSLHVAARRAGLSTRSSAFRRYLAQASASPAIEDRGDGRFVARPEMLPEGPIVVGGLDSFRAKLPPSYGNMLSAIEAEQGGEITKDQIAERAGVSPTSSGLTAGLRELVALELVERTDTGFRLSKDFL